MGTRNIANRKCAIYGNDIPRTAAMMLAKQHNEFNSIQRSTGFAELAACCRKLYFVHFAMDGVTDDGKTDLPRERYNSKKYIAFKQECLALLTTSQIVRSFFFFLSMFNFMLHLIESSTYRTGHTDGTTAYCSLS